MSLFRLLNRRTATILSRTLHPPPPLPLILTRTLSFSSAEEAAAERRRRKRRLRIEPPLHVLRRDTPLPRPPPDPNAKRLPDTTSSLTGPRLNLHNRVQSLIRAGDLDNAAALARDSVFSRTRPTVFTCNALVASMYRAGRFDDAVLLFDYFFRQNNIVPNIVSYNFLINTHCDCGRVDLAREVYSTILADAPFGPSSVTFRHLTKGYVESNRIGEAIDMLREMLNKGLGADSIVYNNLIKGYLDLGELDKANELFDELKERCLVYDGVVNATFMEWFFVQGRGKEAMESYRGLLDREFRMTPVTCNVLLEVLLRHGKKKEAWELFDSMLDNHTTPTFQAVNSESFSIMANECFKEGKYDEAVATFRKVGTKMGSRPFVMDVAGYTNMIVRFTEHGMLGEAEKFFNELQTKSLSHDVTAYRTLIDAYMKENRIDDALGMFNRMVDVKLRVIPLYANRWFTELIENNKAVECSQILTKMGNAEVKPDALTYEIVIKGLVGVGAFDATAYTVGEAMRYGVGVGSSLREFLLEVFEKEGRKEEMEKRLDEKRQGSWQQPRPQYSGSPRPVGGQFSPPDFRQPGPPSGNNGYSAESRTGGYSAPTGYSTGSGAGEYSTPAGPTGYSGSAGPTGYSTGSGTGGYSASAGREGNLAPEGYSAPTGQAGSETGGYLAGSSTGGYLAPTGPTGYSTGSGAGGYSAPSGPTEYSAGSRAGGYSGPVGPTSYPASTGGYLAPTGPTGYSTGSGAGGYSAPSGPTEYSAGSRAGGYSGPVGPTSYPAGSGAGGYSAPASPTGYSAGSGMGGHSTPAGPAGYSAQAGYTGFSAPSGPRGDSAPAGPTRYSATDRPTWDGGFQGPAGPSSYPGGPGLTELPGQAEQLGRYPASGYRHNG